MTGLTDTATPKPKGQKRALKTRAKSAGAWGAFTTFSDYGIRLFSNLVMTRLLLPEAFGMIAMASVVLTALNLFTDFGVQRSVMREPDGDTPHFLRVSWVFRIIRGSVISFGVMLSAVALYFLGPIYATPGTLYAQPEMPLLLAMTGLNPLIAGFISGKAPLMRRRMENRKLVLLTTASHILSVMMMIIFALISPTVWALLAGMLTQKIFLCIFTHVFLPGPKMRYKWDWEIFWRLWTFGKWLLGASALTFLGRHADKLIIAGLITPTAMGVFVIAQIWIQAGRAFVEKMAGGVGFPLVAEALRTRPKDVPRLYRKFQNVIDLMCLAAFFACVFLGELAMNILYTSEYSDAGKFVFLMAPSFLLIRFDTLMNLVMNTGNSRAMMISAGIRAVAMVTMVPLGFWMFELKGAIVASVMVPALVAPYTMSLTKEILGTKQTLFDAAWLVATLVASAIVISVA